MNDDLVLEMMTSIEYKSLISLKNSNSKYKNIYDTNKDYIYKTRIIRRVHCVSSLQDIYLHMVHDVPYEDLCIKNEKYGKYNECTMDDIIETATKAASDKTFIFTWFIQVSECLENIPYKPYIASIKEKVSYYNNIMTSSNNNVAKAWNFFYIDVVEPLIKRLDNYE